MVTRSPGYPAISLDDAIDKARLLWDHVKQNAVPAELIGKYWKYSASSSGPRMVLAALKKYGLIESVGNKRSGEVRLTDAAKGIILDVRENSLEREQLIKEAALRPEIYNELWQHWGTNNPDDDTFTTYLTLNKGFNEQSVKGFIEDYKKTMSFARLAVSGSISKDRKGDPPPGDQEGHGDKGGRGQRRKRPMTSDVKEASFPLDVGEVVITYPESISADEIDDVESWMKLMIRKLRRTTQESIGDSEEGSEQNKWQQGGRKQVIQVQPADDDENDA